MKQNHVILYQRIRCRLSYELNFSPTHTPGKNVTSLRLTYTALRDQIGLRKKKWNNAELWMHKWLQRLANILSFGQRFGMLYLSCWCSVFLIVGNTIRNGGRKVAYEVW